MIEVIGIPGSREFEVANHFREVFASQWPGLAESPAIEEHVKIAANAKLSGGPVSDIDVVIAAVFARSRHYAVRRPTKDREGKHVSGVKVRVKSFVCAVEVKSQDGSGISINGDEINVRYRGRWKSATEQNVKQVHALKAAFENQHLSCFVYRCVVLDGIDELPKIAGRPQPDAGAVAGGFKAGEFLSAVAGVYGLYRYKGEYSISSGKPEDIRKALEAPIFRGIVPTRLDRQKMDRIAARRPESIEIAAKLGEQRVHIRGHGGTGKTVMMLQAAHEAFERHGKRCLILTYNNALASDIRRSLAMLGVPSFGDGGGVEVRTAMSFTYSWLSRLGVSSPEEKGSYETYEQECSEALELIRAGAITREDIAAVLNADLDRFDVDVIIVDEAQDWPQPEAQLLSALYGGQRISIADGREQLLRGRPTNWSKTLGEGHEATERNLSRCLRMKKNLGIFANSVASEAGLNWEVEPNDEAAGGKVILLEGQYGEDPSLVSELVKVAKRDGNDLVDFLHCVPHSAVIEIDGHRESDLSRLLIEQGYETWDAVDEVVRQDFPRSNSQFRIVQYESNRGLEGWVTVLDRFDLAIANREDWELRRVNASDDSTDPVRRARNAAWRWAMISLTRPIDTLVISLGDKDSAAANLLKRVASMHEDFVEFYNR
ncbi:NERD domain-containing protein/DEAD/DEAH box helicase [Aurantiacibacter sp. MUD11]|uniref:nuclease-related domain-containing DEAD/DEAH box helicase n=1 Tax=Aurantiacibacter sp. MUD11 TaxID=3003265 RepID=UPI0022AB4883|nr:NERD domain-containing protein/DEAD/DEAH box helicase [Aurantiacibacter sp. MUD11]WAT19255.1 NERD domain-containing protein/DEAD/DEAH box helicase [Aurantiacibacter sp. MUD11]